jgi:hypothetical protein
VKPGAGVGRRWRPSVRASAETAHNVGWLQGLLTAAGLRQKRHLRTVLLLSGIAWALEGVGVGCSGGRGEQRGEQRRWRGANGCFTSRRKQVRLGLDAERIRACLGRRTWCEGGGWSANIADARWQGVTEPARCGCVRARALAGHAAMCRRGPQARGPYPLKLFSKLSQHLKFKTKVFPMCKNTKILHVDSMKYMEQLFCLAQLQIPSGL